MAGINFIPQYLVEIIHKHKIEYTDELCFAIIATELLLGESMEQIQGSINWEEGIPVMKQAGWEKT